MRVSVLLLFVLLLPRVPVIAEISMDIGPTEISMINGVQTINGQNTTQLGRVNYQAGEVILGEIEVTIMDNVASSNLHLEYRQNDPKNRAITKTKPESITNGSMLRFADEIEIRFESDLYIYAIVEDAPQSLSLTYTFRVVDTTPTVLDPGETYQFISTLYPDKIRIESAIWYNQAETSLILPEFTSKDGLAYSQLYPAMELDLQIELEVSEITASSTLQLKTELGDTSRISINEPGTYYLDGRIPAGRIIHLELVHSGAELGLTIQSVFLFLAVLDTDNNENNQNTRIAEIMAFILTILAYKVASVLGRRKIKGVN